MPGDVTIRFHQTQWHNLPESARIYIGQVVGPLMPDADRILTMRMSEERWAELQAMLDRSTTTTKET